MVEKRHTIFIHVLLSLAAVQQSVGDKFFADRLLLKTENFIESYLKDKIPGQNVAQYNKEKNHLNNTSVLIETIDELRHLKLAAAAPLLIAQNRILRYKLYLIKDFQPVKKQNERPKAKKIISASDKKISFNAEQIFDFVQARPRVRTKDIIDQFSALSERTVKRGLKELTNHGLVKKESVNRARYYSVQQ